MARHTNQAVLLLITIVSTTIAAIMFSQYSWAVGPSGSTDNETIKSVNQIEALAVQLRPGIDGIALIDKELYTICIYQYQGHRPIHERFVLLSARSFRYDRQLEDYNTAEPRPDQVRQILEQAAQKKKQARQVSSGKPKEPDPNEKK